MSKVREFFTALRNGRYVDGGYPTFIVTSTSECLCHACAREAVFEIGRHTRDGCEKFERAFEAVGVNWENPDLYCDECSERIESAYAEDEAE